MHYTVFNVRMWSFCIYVYTRGGPQVIVSTEELVYFSIIRNGKGYLQNTESLLSMNIIEICLWNQNTNILPARHKEYTCMYVNMPEQWYFNSIRKVNHDFVAPIWHTWLTRRQWYFYFYFFSCTKILTMTTSAVWRWITIVPEVLLKSLCSFYSLSCF